MAYDEGLAERLRTALGVESDADLEAWVQRGVAFARAAAEPAGKKRAKPAPQKKKAGTAPPRKPAAAAPRKKARPSRRGARSRR